MNSLHETHHMRKLEQALAQARCRRSFPTPVERRLLRLRAGLSQAALAASVGITTAAISRYESGERSPRQKILERYAEVLDRLARESMEALAK